MTSIDRDKAALNAATQARPSQSTLNAEVERLRGEIKTLTRENAAVLRVLERRESGLLSQADLDERAALNAAVKVKPGTEVEAAAKAMWLDADTGFRIADHFTWEGIGEVVRKGWRHRAEIALNAAAQSRPVAIPDGFERPKAFLRWAVDTFGSVALDHGERSARFVEEAIELAHADYLPLDLLNRIAERVYARPIGDLGKEIGQAQATLECLAEVHGYSADKECDREFARVKSIPKEEWTRRHAAKVALSIANLPSPATVKGEGGHHSLDNDWMEIHAELRARPTVKGEG